MKKPQLSVPPSLVKMITDHIVTMPLNPNDIIVINYTPEARAVLNENPEWLHSLSQSVYASTGEQRVILVLPADEMTIKMQTVEQIENMLNAIKSQNTTIQ